MKKVYLYIIMFLSSGIYAQNPGGIKNSNLWFKTEENTTKNNNYKDFSSNKLKLKVESKQNKPTQQLFNYNESLVFDGIDDYLKSNFTVEDLVNLTIFSVYKDQDFSKNTSLYSTEKAFEKELDFNTSKIIKSGLELEYNQNKTGIPTINTFIEYGLEANSVQSILSETGISTFNIGKSIKDIQTFKGFLPEFIIFKKSLTKSERIRVETYLAIKYGITLKDSDYLDAQKQIIWDKEIAKDFQNNIAGIGRDDLSELYQKQSSSSFEDFRLILSAGVLKEKNSLNNSIIENKSFLIWGNNNGTLTFDPNKTKENLRFLNRKWLMNVSGNASNINSELRFKVDDLLQNIPLQKDETLWLVIDPSAKNSYNFKDLKLQDFSSINNSGQAIYEKINWDLDSTKTDNFTFAIGPNMLVNFAVNGPNCKQNSSNLDLNLKGGILPYKVNIKGTKTSYNQTFTLSSLEFTLEGLQKDSYTMEITDAKAKKQIRTFEVTGDSSLRIDLGNNQIITDNPLVLDASKYITESGVTYSWSSNNGFKSEEPKISINTPGTYKVTARSLDGCESSGEITLTETLEKSIFIANNPAKLDEGIHLIARLPNIRDIYVKVYDMTGKLLLIKNDFADKNYEFFLKVSTIGAYNVEIKVGEETIVKKVIVK